MGTEQSRRSCFFFKKAVVQRLPALPARVAPCASRRLRVGQEGAGLLDDK